MSKNYRPLPNCLTIRESGIDGLGVFAVEDIAGGSDLGVTHLYDFSFKDCFIRTPLGGFINHSEEPNCMMVHVEDYEGLVLPYHNIQRKKATDRKLVTIRDIKKGEELTVSYTIYDPTK